MPARDPKTGRFIKSRPAPRVRIIRRRIGGRIVRQVVKG